MRFAYISPVNQKRELNMNFNIQQFIGIGFMFLAIGATPLGAQEPTSTALGMVPITLQQFPTAETHHMMKVSILLVNGRMLGGSHQ